MVVAPQPRFRVGVGGASCKFTGEPAASAELRVILQLIWPDQGRAKKRKKRTTKHKQQAAIYSGLCSAVTLTFKCRVVLTADACSAH